MQRIMFQVTLIFCMLTYTVFAVPLTKEEAGKLTNHTQKTALWELSGHFEGDIKLTSEQRSELLSRNGITNSVKRWRDGYLVVEFDPALTSDQYNKVVGGLDILRSKTCVNARYRNAGEQDYVFITARNSGCYSWIGKIGGKQDLNLQDPGCFGSATIVHELLHAYGFAHMQSDPMRDSYVWIYWDNIQQDAQHNFQIDNGVSSNGLPYDYDSVMHYTPYAFSKNGGPTILRNREPYYQLGSDNGPSWYDIEKLKRMYNCP